jgi:hypothetical protein
VLCSDLQAASGTLYREELLRYRFSKMIRELGQDVCDDAIRYRLTYDNRRGGRGRQSISEREYGMEDTRY